MPAPFWKKVASAFVVLPPEAPPPEEIPDVSADLDALLASIPEPESAAPAPPPVSAPARAAPASAPTASAAPSNSVNLVFGRSIDEIILAAGVVDSPSSSQRILKMLSGLAAFPRPQQLAMLRALDAADDTWTEERVVTDARARQAALRAHLQAIEQSRVTRLGQLEQSTRDAQAQRQQLLADIDKQIAELTALRDQALADAARTLSELEGQKQACEVEADTARLRVSGSVNDLSDLVSFLTASGPLPT